MGLTEFSGVVAGDNIAKEAVASDAAAAGMKTDPLETGRQIGAGIQTGHISPTGIAAAASEITVETAGPGGTEAPNRYVSNHAAPV